MALFWTEGFESDRFAEKRNANGSTLSTAAHRTGTGRTGNYGGSDAYGVNLGAGDRDDLLVVGSAFKMNSGSNGEKYMFSFLGDGTTHLSIYLNKTSSTTFTVRAYRINSGSGPLLGESASLALPADATWAHFEAKVRLHDSTGTVEVRFGETSVLSVSGVDTRNGGASGLFDSFEVKTGFASVIDDIYACNEQGSVNTDFQGAKRVETLLPTASGATSQGVGSDGNSVNNYALVDDIDPVSATDYVDLVATGDKDTYVHADSAQPTGNAVAGVFVWAYAYKTDAGSRTMKHVARLAGTEADGDSITLLNDVGQFAGDVFEQKPGGGAWTVADVNNAEFGMKAGA